MNQRWIAVEVPTLAFRIVAMIKPKGDDWTAVQRVADEWCKIGPPLRVAEFFKDCVYLYEDNR